METLNQLPCPVLVTNPLGTIQAANHRLCSLVGRAAQQLQHCSIEDVLAPHSWLFLQTEVWSLLHSQGAANELHLQVQTADLQSIPVTVNCQRGLHAGADCYYWVFFVALEQHKVESELLGARQHAEGVARELAKSARFVQTITDAMPSLVAYWDKDLRCHFANKPYLEWFNIQSEDVIGSSMLELLGEPMWALNADHVRAALAGQRQQFERALAKADGSTGYTLVHYIPDLNALDDVLGFFVLINDVTYLKTTESELKLAASVFNNTVNGIMVTDAAGLILSVNPAFSAITGYTAEEVLGCPSQLLRSHHHDTAFYAAIAQSLADHGHWAGELWNRHKSGEAFLEWQSVTTIPGSVGTADRYVSVFNDITERWHKDERIRHLALHDPLTDLPNRQLLMERLGQSIAKTEREPRQLALMFLDLDQFKQVNDTLGHERGDELLVQVAQRLLTLVRQNDTVARLGGDEFVILLDNPLGQDYVAQIAARIVAAVHAPLTLGDQQVQVGASIGIAMHPSAGSTPADLLKNADAAMYAAKRAGKNTYRFFSSAQTA
ncbi:MAG: sensor domain-containing diguanylate cyclase [Rhodoferax sp.]|uniref:sensor domain-containing protein n=1 Tax=Rhodoferax sp. TaxID=50421 RepID=UPI003267ED03